MSRLDDSIRLILRLQRRVEPVFLKHLSGCGLSDSERAELAFHLAETVGDLAPLGPLLGDSGSLNYRQVHDLVAKVVYHWPYHVTHAATLAARMK
jgi:hypothetical protein